MAKRTTHAISIAPISAAIILAALHGCSSDGGKGRTDGDTSTGDTSTSTGSGGSSGSGSTSTSTTTGGSGGGTSSTATTGGTSSTSSTGSGSTGSGSGGSGSGGTGSGGTGSGGTTVSTTTGGGAGGKGGSTSTGGQGGSSSSGGVAGSNASGSGGRGGSAGGGGAGGRGGSGGGGAAGGPRDAGADAASCAVGGDPLKTGTARVDAYDCLLVDLARMYAHPDPMMVKSQVQQESSWDVLATSMDSPCDIMAGWTDAESKSFGLVQVTPACGEAKSALLADGHPNLTKDMQSALWANSVYNPNLNLGEGYKTITGMLKSVTTKYPGCTQAQYVLMSAGAFNSGTGAVLGCNMFNARAQMYVNAVLTHYHGFARSAGWADPYL